jgi:putative membrane protein
MLSPGKLTRNLTRKLMTVVAAGAMTCAGAALAAGAEDTPPAPKVFVDKAAQAGLVEVELGKVALAKSQNAEVRGFAQRMVTDHTQANAELEGIAKTKGLDVPKRLDAEHQAMVTKLQAKSGAEFDAEYSRHMNMDHTKAISLFEAGSKAVDVDIAKFAQKTLPVLKEHKKLAQKLPGQ